MKALPGFLTSVIIFGLLFTTHAGFAQHWEWAKAAHAYPYRTDDVTTDAAGNIYMVHRDFDGEKIAVSKLNPQGTVLWDKEVGCCATLSYGIRIAVDSDGRVYILGEYEGSIQFGNISLQTGNPASDERYTFLTKLNAQGNLVWAINAAGPTQGFALNSQERDVVMDPQGKILITGAVKGNAHFGSVSSPSGSLLPNAFVAKYNEGGSLAWVERATGGASYGASLDTDNQGRIYAIGYYNGAGGGIQWGNTSLAAPYGAVSYFIKLSTSGSVQWSKRINANVQGIATNEAGSSYITGYITGTASMGNGITLTTAGGADMMVARYNDSGNILWARSAGGTEPDYGYDVDIDQDGNCYVVGEYQSATANFGSVALGLAAELDGAGFTARYLPDGNIKWVEPIMPKDYTQAERISATAEGKCHVLSIYKFSGGSLKFGKDITLTNAGGDDVIAKLDGHAIRIPKIDFYEAFICFPCFPFDPVLDYEYRFWAEKAGIRTAIYRKAGSRTNPDEIFRKGDRLEIRLHDELAKGRYFFQLRAILKDKTKTEWTKPLAFAAETNTKVALIYPNPVKEKLTIDYQATEKETLLLTVYDRNGRVLLRENKEVGVGKNTLELSIPAIMQEANPLSLQLQSRVQGTTAWQLIRE